MYEFTKEWCMAMAHREEGEPINAGAINKEYNTCDKPTAFMTLIGLLRRKHRLTVEKFAEKADIDLYDALQIEGNPNHAPTTRTVYNISKFFKIENKALLQLSGITEAREYDMPYDSFQFAACSSGSTDKLTKAEMMALEQFVAIIAKHSK